MFFVCLLVQSSTGRRLSNTYPGETDTVPDQTEAVRLGSIDLLHLITEFHKEKKIKKNSEKDLHLRLTSSSHAAKH